MIIVLMGAPGAGKGTQSRLLEERHKLPQISTGDILRSIKNSDTPLAEEVRRVMDAGKLISDDLVIRVVQERTSQADCINGYILDGFPRTTAQATMLENLAVKQGHRIYAVLVDVPFELLEKRATGRRMCPVCNEIYNVHFKPPKNSGFCDLHPTAELVQRADDTPEKIKVRLETYDRETRPLLDYYQSSNRLRKVDGTQSPEAVYAKIEAAIADEVQQ